MSRRRYRSGGAVPLTNERSNASPEQVIAGDAVVADPARSTPPPEDQSRLALNAQLAHLRQAERLARRRLHELDPVSDPLDHLAVSAKQREWLRAHPDALTNERQRIRLPAAHLDAIEDGLSQDSPEYFAFLEARLGYQRPELMPPAIPRPPPAAVPFHPVAAPEDRRAPPSHGPMVSAPVSRAIPGTHGNGMPSARVELTPEEREAASLSGVSERVYAENKLRLAQRKAVGDYPSGR